MGKPSELQTGVTRLTEGKTFEQAATLSKINRQAIWKPQDQPADGFRKISPLAVMKVFSANRAGRGGGGPFFVEFASSETGWP